jgi:hypothetical protein
MNLQEHTDSPLIVNQVAMHCILLFSVCNQGWEQERGHHPDDRYAVDSPLQHWPEHAPPRWVLRVPIDCANRNIAYHEEEHGEEQEPIHETAEPVWVIAKFFVNRFDLPSDSFVGTDTIDASTVPWYMRPVLWWALKDVRIPYQARCTAWFLTLFSCSTSALLSMPRSQNHSYISPSR